MAVPVIDAHHHLWDLGVRDQDWITGPALAPLRRDFLLADFRPLACANGVTASIIVQTVTVPGETPELLALAAASDLITGVVGWADLTAPDIADRIAALTGMPGGGKLVGLRHQVQNEPDPDWLTRPDVLRGLTAVARAGLVYDLVITSGQLPAAARAAAAVPDLRFVLDHLGKPPIASGRIEPWHADLRRLAALPNTCAKLSGLVTEADWQRWQVADLRPYAEIALAEFGPGRLMFGSDWPVCTLAASYPSVLEAARDLTAQLSPAEREAVFSGTAIAAYGL
jgi:L-fuconolactonase